MANINGIEKVLLYEIVLYVIINEKVSFIYATLEIVICHSNDSLSYKNNF